MKKKKRAVVTVICMSTFAILGVILRIFIAQLFGEECKNPGTVGWLKASQPLCVTASGEASLEGGIIFAVGLFINKNFCNFVILRIRT